MVTHLVLSMVNLSVAARVKNLVERMVVNLAMTKEIKLDVLKA